MVRLFRTLALGLLLLAPLGTRAGEPVVPGWITNDPANRAVTIDLVAGWNGNNRFDNYNGYYQSGLTLLVPTGWTVTIDFRNQDATGPHSVLVTKPYTEAEMELQLTEQDAVVAGAYSKSPTKGQKVGASDRISFTAGKAGLYDLSCGVPAHLMQDMYLSLEVRDGLDRAMTVVHQDKSAASDAPARP